MRSYKGSKQQSGVVLVVGLIILLILTLIGISGMQTSSMEEKMAGNVRDHNLAFHAAESGLSAGEHYLRVTVPLPAFNCINGLYPANGTGCVKPNVLSSPVLMPPIWENIDWSTKSIKYNTDGDTTTIDLSSLSADPRYVIEDIGMVCTTALSPCPSGNQKKIYRITSRAVGSSTDTVVILQSTFEL